MSHSRKQDIFSISRGCLSSLPGVSGGTPLCCAEEFWGVWALSRGSDRRDCGAPVKFAGHQTCEGCHTDILDVKSKGKHAHVNCEACHGALANHADDPSIKPVLPDTAVLCARCHTASAAKPKGFPQVVPADHSNGVACQTCHNPHSPAMDAGGAK